MGALIKPLILILFGTFVSCFYYLVFSHIEPFSLTYLYYFLIMFIVLLVYNFYIISIKGKKTSIGFLTLLGYFLFSLLILSIFFFILSNPNNTGPNYTYGIGLFFKIILYSLFPIIIFFITTSFGKKLASFFPSINKFSSTFQSILSLNLGFISFITLIILGSFLNLYNVYFIIFILLIFSVISIKELVSLVKSVLFFKIKVDLSEGKYFRFFSSEFIFVIFSLVLGVALISIFRPFPIGWDDLGVYMNYPKQLAEHSGMVSLGAMYSWQFFTGIGYVFSYPTLAFFLNISGTFLSFIVLYLIISELLDKYMKKEDEKSFISLPFLLSTLFISIPMVVFQTSKDMKLDLGLFFISISAIYLLFTYILKFCHSGMSSGTGFRIYSESLKSKNTNYDPESSSGGQYKQLIYLFIIGIIAGFAFSIKFTSLLLIVSLLAVLFYFRLGTLGFFSFFSIFVGVFTYGNLWKMMNVVINPSNISGLETTAGIFFFVLGIILLFIKFSLPKILKKDLESNYVKNLTTLLKEVSVFLLGVFIVLLPWLGKNIAESYPDISVYRIIGGKVEKYDFSKNLENIHTKKEIKEIGNKYLKERKKENLVTTNEDLLRYLGYENGILNYVFLPWNLTMQVNQKGEFTDISFVFLALLPLIFIFLPYRKKYFYLFFVFLIALQTILVLRPDYKNIEKSNLSFLSQEEKTDIFVNSNNILNEIYFIKPSNYFSDAAIEKTRGAYPFSSYKKQLENIFYNDIRKKIISKNANQKLDSFKDILISEKDLDLIKKITKSYYDNYVFIHSDVVGLEKTIKKLPIEKQEKILEIWYDHRTLNGKIIDLFAKINIPSGYFVLFLAFLTLFLFLLYSIKDTKNNYLFKLNLVFAFIYIFLWTISAFGIVWYGISMYFSFLLMIAFSSYYFVYYKEDETENSINFKLISSVVLFIIISSYFVISVIPHSFINLKTASYWQYKNAETSYPGAIFDYHRSYVKILSNLNISEDKKALFIKNSLLNFSNIEYDDKTSIDKLVYDLKALKYKAGNNPKLVKQIEKTLDKIYLGILNPDEKIRSKDYIYRAGTFLRYYISDNYKRLLEDNLLFKFNDYIYSEDSNKTIENFKKLGIKYMVVDLNAATIDKSKTHDLTKRYEKMLKTFTSDKLELISTDSICLMIGLEYYKKTRKMDEYMYIAGVNYDSYDENDKKVYRNQKFNSCVKFVVDLKKVNSINDNNYPFLKGFIKLKTPQEVANAIGKSSQVIFKIKD